MSKFQELKEKWEPKLLEWVLIRVLFFDPWFRVAFLLFLLLVLFLALFLPKIWRTSPAGFLPEVRVSGLDFAQAWSLRRAAVRSAERGETEGAQYAWQACIANNLADVNSLRGYIDFALRFPGERQTRVRDAMRFVPWLLRLSLTNQADRLLAANVYDRLEFEADLFSLMPTNRAEPPPELEPMWLKSLFRQGAMDRFEAAWQKASAPTRANPEVALYYAAYQCAWGPPGTAADARARLAAAMSDKELGPLAHRLQLAVSRQRADATGYASSLRTLAQMKSDTLIDHLRYWDLLSATGNLEEAKKQAREYASHVTHAMDAHRYAGGLRTLGLVDEELTFWRDHASRFGYAPLVWNDYANLLIQRQLWEELRALARQIRAHPEAGVRLAGLSHFLDGRADFGDGRLPAAKAAFDLAARQSYDDPEIAFEVARRLATVNYPDQAREILQRLGKTLEKNADYWRQVFTVAAQLRDAEMMTTAAEKCYELKPDETVYANNLAAMLIMQRKDPVRALKLTFQLHTANPSWAPGLLNHSLALIRNNRDRDAEPLLASVNLQRLNLDERNAYYWCLMEIADLRGKPAEARLHAKEIDRSRLYPPQLKWLEEAEPRWKNG